MVMHVIQQPGTRAEVIPGCTSSRMMMEMEMEVKKEMMMTALAATNVSDQKQDSVAGL